MEEKDSPLVSIVCCYFNRKQNLRESIDSLLNQTYKNVEIIIIDDNSIDGTYESLLEVSNSHTFKLIQNESNIGFTASIIKGIELSNGEYIAIHGAGDISYPNRILNQVQYLANHPEFGLVSCFIKNRLFEKDDFDIIKPKISFNKKNGLINHSFSHGELMFNRTYYFKAGGYRTQIKFGQLSDLIYRMANLSKFHIIPEILYERIQFSMGVNRDISKKLLQKYYQNLSLECALDRINGKKDILELYGDNYLIYRKRSKKLAHEYLFQIFKFKDLDKVKFQEIINVSLIEKITFTGLLFQLLGYKLSKTKIPKNFLKLINRIKYK